MYRMLLCRKSSVLLGRAENRRNFASTRMMVKQVLMSIVTLVSFVMAQYEDFSRVTSIGGGLIGTGYYASER